jgi:hypothetical protein
MSKRCELKKDYFQQRGNYKGNGKYSDDYVKWLEDKILAQQQVKKFDLADVGGNEVACDHDYKPIGGGFEKRCSNCNHKTIVE